MPSPFPGMNPYYETTDSWRDFHNNFLMTLQKVLAEKLSERYFVKCEVQEKERERWLEVIEAPARRVVTVIELLSPSNKTNGRGREEYLAKRSQILRSEANFVEIDLRRGGRRPAPPELPECDYCVLVSRSRDRPSVGVWPVGLREELPVIPVPLLEPDDPVTVNLKTVLDETYDRVKYERVIYRSPPEPSLSPEDDAWAAGFIPPGRGANAVAG